MSSSRALAHMNADHSDSIRLLAEHHLVRKRQAEIERPVRIQQQGTKSARDERPPPPHVRIAKAELTLLTLEGFAIRAHTRGKSETIYLDVRFQPALVSHEEYRERLIAMTKEAAHALHVKLDDMGHPLNEPFDPDFYQAPNIPVSLLIICAILVCGVVAFGGKLPGGIEWIRSLGLRLFRSEFGVSIVFAAAVVAHIYEGLLAYKSAEAKGLSTKAQLKWLGATLLVGYPSLKLLLAYPSPYDSKKAA